MLLSAPSLSCLVGEITPFSRQSRSLCGKAPGECCLLWSPAHVPRSGSCPLQPWRRKGSGRALRKGSFLSGHSEEHMPPQGRGEGVFQLQGQSRGLGDLEPPLGLALMLATVLHHTGGAQDTGVSLTSFWPGRGRTAENPEKHSFGVSGDLGGTRGKGE